MIEFVPRPSSHVLVFKARGRVSENDYQEEIVPRIAKVLHEFDKAHIVFYEGEDFEAFDRDPAEFFKEQEPSIGKIAVVSKPAWKEWVDALIPSYGETRLRGYDLKKMEDAWSWAEQTKMV